MSVTDVPKLYCGFASDKCIENLDSDAISKLQAKADELKGDIHCNKGSFDFSRFHIQ